MRVSWPPREARVGRVDAFSIPGVDLWFNSSDHLPPHFHASRRGEWELRVFFLLCTDDHLEWTLKWKAQRRAIPGGTLESLREVAVRFRVALLTEWENKVEPR